MNSKQTPFALSFVEGLLKSFHTVRRSIRAFFSSLLGLAELAQLLYITRAAVRKEA